jgi:excisionase family DNA binding protein
MDPDMPGGKTAARPRPAGGVPRRAARDARSMDPLATPAMRLSEVGRRLAISRAAAYRLVRSGQLRGIQIGQTWRVLRADFDAYLDARRAESEGRYRHAWEEP